MKTRTIVILLATVSILALLWAAGGAIASPPRDEPAGDEVSVAGTVASKFSYQGVLKENDSPVTGSRDMTFRLYSDDTCSTQVGSDIVKSGVQVTDGLFSVDLAVTHGHFNGQGLWLEVEVGGTKIGCQEILPVPYALSVRPGAVIGGAGAGDGSIYLKDANNETVLEIRADYAYLDIGGPGNEGDILVRDEADEIVFAVDADFALVTIGGPGNEGDIWVRDEADKTVFDVAADRALVTIGGPGNDGDIWVKDEADKNTFTVDGQTGTIWWKARTGYIAVPAAAFRPWMEGYVFKNAGRSLKNVNDTSDFYFAPVQLPHGATVTKLTFYWFDTTSATGSATLRRSPHDGSYSIMAGALTSGSAGNGSSYDGAIDFATIDNTSYAYYLLWDLPNSFVWGYHVVIEYTFTGPY